ncbi:hypothetical protein ABZX77_01135 [Streptomyces sp. NPDC004237]|uniref:hypothetical protein n=1 Tax=Streptomyces sp. NPDC004237 TaxID=3154455 RepID=UPI0033B68F48
MRGKVVGGPVGAADPVERLGRYDRVGDGVGAPDESGRAEAVAVEHDTGGRGHPSRYVGGAVRRRVS